MNSEDQGQGNRYTVFSYSDVPDLDEGDLFRDQEINAKTRRINKNFVAQKKRKNQTIVNIYDQIASNNESDPLYPKHLKQKHNNYSTVTSTRASNKKLPLQTPNQNTTLSKFMNQFAKDVSHKNSQINYLRRIQKVSLLKKIIEHYNMKSVQKKYYSNLVKTFGLKIQSFNTPDIFMKNDIHGSQKIGPEVEWSEEKDERTPKESLLKNFKHSASFTLTKEDQSFAISKEFSVSQYNRPKNMQTSKNNQKQMFRKSIDMSNRMMQKPLKMQSSGNSIESKLNKYRDFLFLLNLSNHLYRNLDITQYQRPFKYYVGRGNNGNLIKSLMKKRFWFEQTSNPKQANFIWTQIKLQLIFERQKSHEHLQEDFPESGKMHLRDQLRINFKTAKNRFSRFNRNKSTAKNFQPINPILKICTEQTNSKHNSMTSAMNYKKNPTFTDRLKYIQGTLNQQTDFTNTIIQNHLPFNGLLGNKKAMFYNVREFCRLSRRQTSELIPMTFHIRNGFLDEEYKEVSRIFNERKKKKEPNYWIIKPGEFSNRGQGISCTNKLEEIRKRISKCKQVRPKNKTSTSFNPKSKDSTLIIQLYIHNPLLYNYRKFDIRAFMMITIHNGKIKGYWYQEGYVRTSSFIWTLNDIEDTFIHLTNDAVQKNCEQYGLFQPGNKISYTELQRYLQSLPNSGPNFDFFKQIYPKMRSMAADMIKSTFLNLDPSRKRDNFQIFGLDFMIDQNFKPWLIEVNTNPCLEITCPILQRIIPNMIQNAFRISLDPLFPPPSSISQDYKYAIPENALIYNKFELIFDEDREGPILKDLYKDSTILQQLDDLEEDQQIFEEQGKILELKNF